MFMALFDSLLKACAETLYMVFIAGFLGILFGLILGTILFLTRPQQIAAHPIFYGCLSLFVNITRSIPFVIFMIAIIPLTKMLIGTTIGINAAVIPLLLAAIPFYARITESAFTQIDPGVLTAVQSMGANHWQLIYKVLLPETFPVLVQGATLTLISLVGYSAMAGAVGGGGLGELAIEYGYQRFNIPVMLETVVLLIILVQLLQWYGDKLANQRSIKSLIILCLIAWLACLSPLIFSASSQRHDELKVGIVGGPNEEIMQVAKLIANKRYGLQLKLVHFSDYILPNQALDTGDIDANIFQHIPYLETQVKLHHYNITALAKTFIYPMGFYSRHVKKLADLPRGALVAIPNDPSNEGRALLLLQAEHLITLSSKTGLLATPNDIVANPHQLIFKTVDAAQIPRVLDSVTMGALTNDYTSAAHFQVSDALFHESKDAPYANVIVVRRNSQHAAVLHTLVEVMHSPEVIAETEKLFPQGAAIRAW